MAKGPYRVLCLAGGAPNLTLMSGALHRLHQEGLHENNKGPNIITMAGAGAVIGLHYLAPKGLKSNDPFSPEALENTVNFGVSDAIYEMLPINYKVFTKSGPSADIFNEFWLSLPEVREAMHQSGTNDDEALLSDGLLLAGAMMCPTDVDFFSQGICGHAKFLEDLIDFEAVKRIDPNDLEIEINAFCIEDQKLVDFTNYERDENGTPKKDGERYIPKAITVDHLRAALAFPFLHAPYKIGDKHYFEGAAMQCLNDYTKEDATNIDWFIVLDPLRSNMIGMPSNLWEAFALSIIMPTAGLTELGRDILEFKNSIQELLVGVVDVVGKPKFDALVGKLQVSREHKPFSPLDLMLAMAARDLAEQSDQKKGKLYFSTFEISKEKLPQAWGWSRSSMKGLFEVGRTAGTNIAEQMRKNGHLRTR